MGMQIFPAMNKKCVDTIHSNILINFPMREIIKRLCYLTIVFSVFWCKAVASHSICRIEYAIQPTEYWNSNGQDSLDLRELGTLLNDGDIGPDAAAYIVKKFIADNNYTPGLLPPLDGKNEKIKVYVICVYRIVLCMENNSRWTTINKALEGNPFTYPQDSEKMEKKTKESKEEAQKEADKAFQEALNNNNDHTDACNQNNQIDN